MAVIRPPRRTPPIFARPSLQSTPMNTNAGEVDTRELGSAAENAAKTTKGKGSTKAPKSDKGKKGGNYASNRRRLIVDATSGDVNFADVSILLPFATDGADASSNGHEPTTVGTPLFVTGKYTGALDTNGGNNYYTYPDAASLGLGAEEFTMEAWVYFPTVVNGSLFGKGNTSVTKEVTILHAGGVGFAFRYSINGTSHTDVYSNIAPSNATWHHVAFCRDVDTLRSYVDGVAGSTGDLTGKTIFDGAGDFWTGGTGSYTAGDHWLEDVRVTKGVCRYPDGTSFDPPAANFPTS